jgi:hypothetical protein
VLSAPYLVPPIDGGKVQANAGPPPTIQPTRPFGPPWRGMAPVLTPKGHVTINGNTGSLQPADPTVRCGHS